MENQTETAAALALEVLDQAYAYYDAPKATQATQPEPQEYFEYFAAA
ncbi:hypothetical protein [Pseudorhodobacter sp.]|nr:hypothetical protein [Pseudorhodobacter sp.]